MCKCFIKYITKERKSLMRIDFAAVQKRFADTGRAPTLWARVKGINEAAFRNYITGRAVPASNGIVEQRLIKLLAEDNLLVLKEVEEGAKGKIKAA